MATIVSVKTGGTYEVYPSGAHMLNGCPPEVCETWAEANDLADKLDGKPQGFWRAIPERTVGMPS